MKKLLFKQEGFTLIELIAVIAILSVLAGAAIPSYSGYVTKARDAAALAKLEAISAAVQAADVYGEITEITVEGTTVRLDCSPVSGPPAGDFWAAIEADVVLFYDGALAGESDGAIELPAPILDGTSYANGARWDGTAWSPA